MERYNDTVVEFLDGNDHITVSTGKKKYINKIKKWADEFSDDVKYVENADGSVCATMPISWFRFPNPKKTRTMTEEEKIAASERMRKLHGRI